MNKNSFSFGKNWQRFLNTVTDDTIVAANDSLTNYFGISDFSGKSFVDVGCGSGLFSYAAYLLGAEKIVSIDVDPFSVECCNYFRNKAGNPSHWQVQQKSVLDQEVILELGKFDLVYSFGVLHHTGNMWQAIRNTASLVAEDGYFYLAIYNKIPGKFGSLFWLKVVKLYNRAPRIVKRIMEGIYVIKFFFQNLIKFKNPLKKIRKHRTKRGMSWLVDVADDLGGYPYDYASVDEVFSFMKHEFPDFVLVKLRSTSDRGNNKFVFHRSQQSV